MCVSVCFDIYQTNLFYMHVPLRYAHTKLESVSNYGLIMVLLVLRSEMSEREDIIGNVS